MTHDETCKLQILKQKCVLEFTDSLRKWDTGSGVFGQQEMNDALVTPDSAS